MRRGSARSPSGDAGPRRGHPRSESDPGLPTDRLASETRSLPSETSSSFAPLVANDESSSCTRTRSPVSAGSLSEDSNRRAGPPTASPTRPSRETVTLCLRCVDGVIETSSACSRPPGVAGADGKSATLRCLAVFPKNSRRTRAAKKSHESFVKDISRSAPSFAAASFRALRMRAAFPCDTLRPRLLDGRSGSITFMCLMGTRTRGGGSGSSSREAEKGEISSPVSALASPPALRAPFAPRAACRRMMDSLPYLSSMRHMNSGVRSSSEVSSSSASLDASSRDAVAAPDAPAPGPSPPVVPAARSARRTGPCMLTACASQSKSAKTRRNVCSTSRGVVSDAFAWNLFST